MNVGNEYERPEMEVIYFTSMYDVITQSVQEDLDKPGDDWW